MTVKNEGARKTEGVGLGRCASVAIDCIANAHIICNSNVNEFKGCCQRNRFAILEDEINVVFIECAETRVPLVICICSAWTVYIRGERNLQ